MAIPLDEIKTDLEPAVVLRPQRLSDILGPVLKHEQVSLIHSSEKRPLTILAHTVLVAVAESGCHGVYLDTGGKFRPSLIRFLTSSNVMPEEILSRIHKAPVLSLDDLVNRAGRVRKMKKVSLVVLDSLTVALNLTMAPGQKGRQRILFNTLEVVRQLVNDTGVHVLMTDHSTREWKTGRVKPIGGNVLSHDVDSIVHIDSLPERSSYVRILVERCPLSPQETGVVLNMTKNGFKDIKEEYEWE